MWLPCFLNFHKFVTNKRDKVCIGDLMGTFHDDFNMVRRELSHMSSHTPHPSNIKMSNIWFIFNKFVQTHLRS